ncbi:dipeptidyl carboxypeptidase [Lutibacter profundi]|uniref:Dipeptidyl carboxypeptidase n=1 Tax=Lutibacter profundi TaxID=1622118 RepID=A0A0X8G5N7_9FLAO|nr:M3 family metallopeptidase [Lutibacter profundi]AMC10118.1 dipeptidyl carboxypeptidase [Lutibacter profundi]
MKKITLLLILLITILSCNQKKENTPMENNLTNNPFLKESTLPYSVPNFTEIKNEHFKPAYIEALRQQTDAVNSIVKNNEEATFKNTILALEKSKEMLDRVNNVFNALTAANTNDLLKKVQSETAPLLAKHFDEIYLNDSLFSKVKYIYAKRNKLKLDSESLKLVEYYYKKFTIAGANLTEDNKIKLRDINEQLASLSTTFNQTLLEANKAATIEIHDIRKLDGFSETQIANIKDKTKENTWLLTITNTTQQSQLQYLKNRDVRKQLFEAGWNRTNGRKYSTKELVKKMVELRAQKATLLGFNNFASWQLQNTMAKKPQAVLDLFAKLVPAATSKARKEAAIIQKMIEKQGETFKLEPWDWNFYAEKVRKEKYDLDENEIKPYFELHTVLEKGVFYAAKKLYGITFKKRTDIPTYQKDVITYELFNEDGSTLGLFYADYYARPSKSGGAWMDNFVTQSTLYNKKPVIYNVMNIAKPAEGEPTLLNFDEVETMFHEFGHALHGFFANQHYPSLSGTSVARDFVEFPSQFNENWALYPEILKNYALNYKNGNKIPNKLIDKIKNASTFNQGYSITEVLAASNLDMLWHTITANTKITDVNKFENDALESVHLLLKEVPTRYRSTYFAHIFSGGYSAGYYSYLWTEVLSHDAYDYFTENGGLTRENGQRFRDMILSKGNTLELEKMYKDFRGSSPKIEPMIKARGLN